MYIVLLYVIQVGILIRPCLRPQQCLLPHLVELAPELKRLIEWIQQVIYVFPDNDQSIFRSVFTSLLKTLQVIELYRIPPQAST